MSKIQTPHEFKCDLDVGSLEVKLREPLMHQDSLADVFRVRVLRNGIELSLSGMVARGFMYSEVTRETIPLPGVVEGSFASVTLIDKCYAVPGEATLSIQLQEGDVCHTLANIHFDLRRTGTNVVTDPAGVLPTLPVLLSKITALEQTTDEARQTISDVKAEGDEAVEQTMAAAADARLAAQEITGSSASPIRKSATGKCIELDNAADKPLRGLKLYGRTEQKTTTGKNLLNAPRVIHINSETSSSARLYSISTKLPAGTYTLSCSGYSADNSGAQPLHFYYFDLNNKEVYPGISMNHFNTYFKATFTAEAGIDNCAIYVSVADDTYTVHELMLERGSVATAYEPYSGGYASPSPNWPQPLVSPGDSGSIGVKARGRNMLPYPYDFIVIAGNGITFTDNGDGTVTANGTATAEAECILIDNAVGVFRLGETYTINDANILFDGVRWVLKGETFTVTAADIAVKASVRIRVSQGTTLSNAVLKPQVVIGNTSTAYEPYKDGGSVAASTPNGLPGIKVSSGGNYVDTQGQMWLCDEKDYERGVYVQRLLNKVYDGSENWFRQMDGVVGINSPDGIFISPLTLCSAMKFGYSAWNGSNETLNCFCVDNNGNTYFNTGSRYTLDTWKQYLQNNPMTMLYVLSTPIETPLSAAELASYRAMSTFDPYTVVYSDSDVEMTVDYIGETEKFVHEVIDDRAAPPIVETASGSVVSITDGANRPVVELISHIEPVQTGSGDPSPNNKRPISGWNSVAAQRTGKNLLNVPQPIQLTNAAYAFDIECGLQANKTYTLSFVSSTSVNCQFHIVYTNGDSLMPAVLQTSPGTKIQQTVTLASDAEKVRLYVAGVAVLNDVMIEESSAATTYEPYQGQTLAASLPETVYGGKRNWSTGELISTKRMYQFTGEETLRITSSGYFQVVEADNPAMRLYEAVTNTATKNIVCSHYSGCAYAEFGAGKVVLFAGADGTTVTFGASSFADASAFKAYLSAQYNAGTPVTIVFDLLPAYWETLTLKTPQQLYTLKGKNNVWSDCGSTELSYVADTKSYIDKKLAAIAAALIEQ